MLLSIRKIQSAQCVVLCYILTQNRFVYSSVKKRIVVNNLGSFFLVREGEGRRIYIYIYV